MRWLLFYFLLLNFCGWSQNQEQSFEGFFRGDNLKIQCRTSPTTPWAGCDCIDSVIVNGENYGNIIYEGHQVDLANQTSLKIFEALSLNIYYQSNNELRLLNPYQFLPKTILPVSELAITEDGKLSWTTEQNLPDLKLWCQVEVYKWGDWMKVGPNFNIGKDSLFQFKVTPFLHRGSNRIRVTVASIDRDRVPSTPIEFDFNKKRTKAKIKAKKRKVFFKLPTHYKLYNDKNQLVEEDVRKEIDLDDYPTGTYHLWFGQEKKSFKLP